MSALVELTDEAILDIYFKAIDHGVAKDFIALLEEEIIRRGICTKSVASRG
jgi:hypothetical protein